MAKLQFFYESINGGFLAILFSIISLVSTIVSISLFKKKDATFSFFTHWLPTYGDTVPKTVAHIFNTNVIILSPIMAMFILYLSLFLEHMGASTFLIFVAFFIGSIASLGQFFVGIIPANYSFKMHMIAALFFFGGTAIYGTVFSIIELTVPGFPVSIAIIGFMMTLFFSVFFILLILINVDTTRNQNLPAIWEWLSYFSIIIWVTSHGFFILYSL